MKLYEMLRELVRRTSLDALHPIGSIYWSFDPTDPEKIFGGKWKAITDRFIYAAGVKGPGDTGGEETHALTVDEIPSHEHDVSIDTGTSGEHQHVAYTDQAGYGATIPARSHYLLFNGNLSWTTTQLTNKNEAACIASSGNHSHKVSGSTGPTGGGQAHNNMPPYIVAYCWRRTA